MGATSLFGDDARKSVEDYDAQAFADEIEESLQKLSHQDEQLFEISLSIVIQDKNEARLMQRGEFLCKLISSIHNAVGIVDHYNHLDNFFSFVPGQSQMNQKSHLVFTSPLTQFIPVDGMFLGGKNQELLLKNTKNELIPISFRQNDLPSSHVLVVAPTGKGKSFTVNYLLKSILSKNESDYVTIIDKGGSYIKLCAAFEGSYLSIDLDEKYALNIFPQKRKILHKITPQLGV